MITNFGWRAAGLACAVAVTALLTGCQRIGEQVAAIYYKEAKVNAPTLVLDPGYKVVLAKTGVSGETSSSRETVMLSGFDKCPKQDRVMEMLFGPAPDEDRNDSIVLDKTRSSVKVQVAYLTDRRVAVEEWNINRVASPAGERVSLVPPSGAILLEASLND